MSEPVEQVTAIDGLSVEKTGPFGPNEGDVVTVEATVRPASAPTGSGTVPVPSTGSPQAPAPEHGNAFERAAEGTFVRFEHVVQYVERFAREHPGLDRIFVQGLLAGLHGLELSSPAAGVGMAVLGALEEKPKP
jgi:hypothetical protein